jgi:hypothetical protein
MGSVLSPILFILYVNAINNYTPADADASKPYAD